MGQLEASMRKYGYVTPMTAAADGEIIDGSARAETGATVFGDDVLVVHHDGTKPVIMVRDDIPSADTPEAREISIAANRIAQVNLDFDPEVLLGDLQAGVDLAQFWRNDELDELLADLTPKPTGDTEPQTDRAEELREKWGVRPGDLWQLGEHRLIVGDCTDPATVARVMGGERADFVFGDPPYEMEPSIQAALIDSFDAPTLWFGSIPPLANVLRCSSRRVVYDFAWLTGGRALLPNRNFIIPMHKNIVLFAEKLPELIFDGASYIGKGKLPSVLEVEYDFEKQHKHEKPLNMVMALLASYKFTNAFDPFCGSGTTIIACANLKRRCFGCELSAEYTAVCLQRYMDHTGIEPRLCA